MDFTLETYKRLLSTLSDQGFSFSSFEEFIIKSISKNITLRHDVDDLPGNSLKFATIQAEMGIKGTYYFRVVPESYDEAIIKEIYEMGHEVGYHYEDVSLAAERQKIKGKRQKAKSKLKTDLQDSKTARLQDHRRLEKDLVDIAIESFSENLEKLRKIAPVKTICMHGSPMSRWDSRLLWKYYDYRDFGIIGEPYFDVNFDEVMYLTDTGRRWDGEAVSVRDKADGGWQMAEGKRDEETKRRRDEETKRHLLVSQSLSHSVPQSLSPSVSSPIPHTTHHEPFPKFHSTFDIILAAEKGTLPDKMMMTFHPQRWTDKPVPWVKELVWQNVKNVVKYFVVNRNG